MKRFLNIFLAVSLFFNLGFAFSEAKASPVPIPLSVIGDQTQPYTQGPYPLPLGMTTAVDLQKALYRITYLEALFTGVVLGQSIGSQDDINSISSEQVLSVLNYGRATIDVESSHFPSIIDVGNTQIITNRILEIKSRLNVANLRISDLKALMKAFILGVDGPPISGVDNDVNTGDINFVRQELYRAREYKKELEFALRFWSHLIGSNEGDLIKVTSINPNRARAGNVISIDGEGFSNAFAIILSGSNVSKRIEIPVNSILSNNRISFTVPNFAGVTGDLPIKISVLDDEANTSLVKNPNFTYQGNAIVCNSPPTCTQPQPGCSYVNIPRDANGCVTGCGILSCPENTCKCPSGQLSLSVGGVRRCATLNTSTVSCNRYGNHPVCGCDGNTYQNSCYALINGLKAYTDGACPGQ